MASTHPVCTGLARLAALALVCGAAACAHAPGAAKSDSISPQSSDPHAPLKGPGVEYKLIDLGVPSQTLDFVGTESTALAGAKASGDIFFGNVTDTALEVYQRSLKSGERTYVTQLKPYQNGSLSATPDGKRLVYCRFRELKDVIDDPTVTYPQKIAVPYVFDVAKQEEQRLFDFGKPEFRQWRASGCMPSISPDGKSVYVLVYDMDRVVLHNQAKEWLDRDKHLLAHDPKQSAEDRKSEQDLVDGYITAQSTRILLKNEGVTVDPAKPATDAVRAAMRKFFDDTATPHAALLINEDGKSRVLPLQGEANSEADYRFIAATGNHTLIVAAQQLGGSLFSEEPLYLVDQQTGKLQKFGSFTGLSKLVTLSSDEHELLICYNPFDAATKQIVTHTYLRHIPLDGSKPVEADLLGDYLGNVVDLDSSATHLAG